MQQYRYLDLGSTWDSQSRGCAPLGSGRRFWLPSTGQGSSPAAPIFGLETQAASAPQARVGRVGSIRVKSKQLFRPRPEGPIAGFGTWSIFFFFFNHKKKLRCGQCLGVTTAYRPHLPVCAGMELGTLTIFKNVLLS